MLPPCFPGERGAKGGEKTCGMEGENEGGDVLFAAVNVLRALKVEPEVALVGAVEKFSKRFSYVESNCTKPMNECSAEELDELWEKAKNED